MRPGICAFWPTFETGHAQHSPMRSTRNLSGRIATHTPMCMQSMECRIARDLATQHAILCLTNATLPYMLRDLSATPPITIRWPLALPNLLPCVSNLSDFCILLSEQITAGISCRACGLSHEPRSGARKSRLHRCTCLLYR